jgi:hypothetical protein
MSTIATYDQLDGGNKVIEPNLKLAGCSLWVLGRQYPESDDYWDGNWLRVRVLVEASGARVEHVGSFLRTDEIEEFARQIGLLDTTLTGEAILPSMEPTLRMALKLTRGTGEVTVAITPDLVAQSHEFKFEIDQSYLKSMLADCRRILVKWPVISLQK